MNSNANAAVSRRTGAAIEVSNIVTAEGLAGRATKLNFPWHKQMKESAGIKFRRVFQFNQTRQLETSI